MLMFLNLLLLLTLILFYPTLVFCEPVDLTTVTIDIVSLETMAGTVLVALAVMWGIRKLIKTINRS